MNPPADHEDNPYQAPHTPSGGPGSEDRTANGTAVKVGLRRRFTGRWIVSVLATFAVVVIVPMILLESLFGLWGLIGWPVAAFVFLGSWCSGNTRVAAWFETPPFRPECEFIAECAFQPRLPTKTLEAADTADDVGRISIDGEFLHWHGDRVAMSLHRTDISVVIRQGSLGEGGLDQRFANHPHVSRTHSRARQTLDRHSRGSHGPADRSAGERDVPRDPGLVCAGSNAMNADRDTVERDDNPYQAPRTPTAEPDEPVAEEGTENGSYLRIGPPKKFTARWIEVQERWMVLRVLTSLFAVVALAAGIWSISAWLSVPVAILCFGSAAAFFGSWLDSTRAEEQLVRTAEFREESEFIVQLRLQPPLKKLLKRLFRESFPGADDLGILSFSDEYLHYKGDRVEIRLHREDTRDLQNITGFRSLRTETPGDHAVIEFQRPLLTHRRIKLSIGESGTVMRTTRRYNQMARTLQTWFRGDESATGAPR